MQACVINSSFFLHYVTKIGVFATSAPVYLKKDLRGRNNFCNFAAKFRMHMAIVVSHLKSTKTQINPLSALEAMFL